MQALRARGGGAEPPSFRVEWEISLEGNKYIQFKLQVFMFMRGEIRLQIYYNSFPQVSGSK